MADVIKGTAVVLVATVDLAVAAALVTVVRLIKDVSVMHIVAVDCT